jgi:hypothetical protein
MITIETKSERFATNCKSCGSLLKNPGYHQNMVFCCDKYRIWTDTNEYTYEFDDGRDGLGRFHHAPKTTILKIKKTFDGGN